MGVRLICFWSFSSDLCSSKGSVPDLDGVVGASFFSGDLDGELPPSIIRLRSRTDDGCSDCMRRCAGPLPVALSGETSGVRFVSGRGTSWFSRAFSVRAACADWMADDVPAREVAVTGDCGFKGSGGGARSGSELSHLIAVLSLRKIEGMVWREGSSSDEWAWKPRAGRGMFTLTWVLGRGCGQRRMIENGNVSRSDLTKDDRHCY